MSFAKSAGLLKDNITVIIHAKEDPHAKELAENYLKKFNVNIMYAEPGKVYCFEHLYFIPTAVRYPNHAFYLMPEDCIFPSVTKEAMKECLVEPYADIISDSSTADSPKKIYLARRGTYRTMINWQEAENFFIKEGFTVIEPHKMTLPEKIKCFHGAEYVIGPASSAFMNIIWCKPNAKVMAMSNYCRCLEATGAEIAAIAGAKLMLVTGEDKEKDGCHSSFVIPTEKIREAYSYLQGV